MPPAAAKVVEGESCGLDITWENIGKKSLPPLFNNL